MAAQERFPGMSEETLRREIRELRGQIGRSAGVARDIIEEAGLPRPADDQFPQTMTSLSEVERGGLNIPPDSRNAARQVRRAIGRDMGRLNELLRERSARRNRW